MSPGEFRTQLENCTSDHSRQSCFRVNRFGARNAGITRCMFGIEYDFQRVDESRGFLGASWRCGAAASGEFFICGRYSVMRAARDSWVRPRAISLSLY
jgi:hypothetical protein